jgi:hypothetical protein
MTKHLPFLVASLGPGLIVVAASAQAQEPSALEGLPHISLRAEPSRVPPGAPSLVTWTVEGAEDLVLIEGPAPMDPPVGNRSMMSLFESGERVAPMGERFVDVESTKEFRILARNGAGVASAGVVVGVELEPVAFEPVLWNDAPLVQPFHESAPARFVGSLDTLVGHVLWPVGTPFTCISGLASAKASTTPQVIFENETATHSWSVKNATAAERGAGYVSEELVADPSQLSGTSLGGTTWGGGGVPKWSPAGGSDSGTETVYGKLGSLGARVHTYEVIAYGSVSSVSAAAWVDVLSPPSFTGSYSQLNYPGSSQTRKQAILSAIKTDVAELRDGCIYNDVALDVKVAAFKNNQLNRKEVWRKVLREMQNLDNITFDVLDVAGSGGGGWEERANTIHLDWPPSATGKIPKLTYVILHELIHKSGFNSELKAAGYSSSQIENMTYAVTDSCFP